MRPQGSASSDPAAEPVVHVGRRINELFHLVKRHMRGVLGQVGMTVPTWLLLDELASHPDCIQRQLASAVQMSSAALVAHLDRMEADGLLERRPDPDDRRASRVRLTEGGRRLHAEATALMDAMDRDLTGAISEGEMSTFRSVLERLLSSLEQAPGVDGRAGHGSTPGRPDRDGPA